MYAMQTKMGVCVKIIVNDFEISLAFDSSCKPFGLYDPLPRGDIAVFKGDDQIMPEKGDILPATLESLKACIDYCQSH